MKPLHFLLSFVLIGLFVSCTENDEPLDAKTLTIKTDVGSTDLPINKIVTFTVTGSNGADYTDDAQISINDSIISGNTYTFQNEGTYNVSAKFDNLTSNALIFNIVRALRIDRKSLLKNQIATFSYYDLETQENVTGDATFYVNDSPISGNTFSSANTGSYEVYAEYQNADDQMDTSDVKTINVVEPIQRALIEDYTGTWCGYCPRLQAVITHVEEMTDYAVVIALHASSNVIDPYEYENIDQLVDAYNEYNVFPTGRINRTVKWNDNDPQTVLGYLGGESKIGIAARTLTNGAQLNVDVRIASTEGLANRKIVVAILENHLFHDQENYLDTDPDSEWYGAGNPIPNYENDHVMRHAMTNIFGDPIPDTNALDDFTKSYSVDLSQYCDDPSNAEVVIFVLDNDGLVKQVEKVGLNETVEFN